MGNLKFVFLIIGLTLIVFSIGGLIDARSGSGLVTTAFVLPGQSASNKTEMPTPILTTTATLDSGPTMTVMAALTQVSASTPTLIPTSTLAGMYLPSYNFGGPVRILGRHIVLRGEHLYCIGRGYGVQPLAIAEANFISLDSILNIGQVLRIPDVQWINMPTGRICNPQFKSPYTPANFPIATPGVILPAMWNDNFFDKTSQGGGSSLARKAAAISSIPRRGGVQFPSPLLASSLDEMPMEHRNIKVESPCEMPLGVSGDVTLTFGPFSEGTGESVASTITPGSTATSRPNHSPSCQNDSTSITILSESPEYYVFAIARLDAAGFSYSPQDDIQYLLKPGESLTWRWSIKPEDVGQQTLILSLKLHFESKTAKAPPPDQQIWSESYQVTVSKNLFGSLFGTQTPISSIVTFSLGCIISILSIWEKIRPAKSPTEKQKTP